MSIDLFRGYTDRKGKKVVEEVEKIGDGIKGVKPYYVKPIRFN